jgi:glycosyltransferase involved in cell wall biosynthesis
MTPESKTDPVRKILALSLFDVPLPTGGVSAFLDNTDSLWDALEHVATVHHLPLVQVFTVRFERLGTTTITARRGSALFLFRAKRPLLNLVWLVKLIRHSAVVIMNNESWSDLFSAVVGRICGAHIVMYYHNADKALTGKLPPWALRLFRTRFVDAGATSSPAMRDLFAPSVKAPITILPFGVDADTFAYGKRQPSPILRAVFCGRISREKRIEDIVQGIAAAGSRRQILFTVVGEEQDPERPYSASVQQLAETLGVALTFAGHTPHSVLRQRLMEADVLVNLRPDEGFGKVFIEAMATGLPVIGRRNSPGPTAIIQDGDTGFLVNDAWELATILDRLHGDQELRAQVGRRAHESVMATYTTAHSLRAAEMMFANLLGCNAGTPNAVHRSQRK